MQLQLSSCDVLNKNERYPEGISVHLFYKKCRLRGQKVASACLYSHEREIQGGREIIIKVSQFPKAAFFNRGN